MKIRSKSVIALALSFCMIFSTGVSFAGTTAEESNVEFYGNELDVPSETLSDAAVIAAVSQTLSADSLVKGTLSSVSSESDDSSELEISLAEVDSSDDFETTELDELDEMAEVTDDNVSVIDTATNPENGETIYVTEPTFEVPTPQAEPEGTSSDERDEVQNSAVTVGSTRTISDNNSATRTLECLYVGTYCTVWGCTSDKSTYSGLEISSSSAAKIGQQFDSYCPSIKSSFGDWYDADSDGKLAIYCYDIDKNYVNGASGSYTAGYFMPANLINSSGYVNGIYVGTSTKALATDCIHLDTYPAMASSRSSLFDSVSDTYSTLVHETQHLINYSYQVAGGTKATYYDSMETYLNEAFSMAAEHMICGSDSTSSRVTYFNGSSYLAGSPLTYWASNLSNYSNSYLFGQYLRTRYARETKDSTGNTLFKKILEARQSALGGDTLSQIATALDTNSTQLVMDFWAAVYLKESTGDYGFNGESWADAISPKIYSSSNTNGIYNGGAIFYDYTVNTANKNGEIGFITFDNGDVEMSGAPEISNISVERTDTSTITFSFETSKNGTLYYKVSDTSITDTSSLQEYIEFEKGKTSLDISIELSDRQEGRLYYYVADSETGEEGNLSSAWIPAVEYMISVDSSDRGTLTLTSSGVSVNDGDYVKRGAQIEVSAEPKTGYYVKSILLDGDELVGNTFMVSGAHKISATYSVEEAVNAEQFSNGEGTEESPYMISNVSEWKYFVSKVNAGDSMEGKYIALSSDIDFEGQTIVQIGTSADVPFEGTLDGNNYTIRNLEISLTDQAYVGVFGYNAGAISNLKLEDVNIKSVYAGGTGYVGTIAGYNAGNIEYVAIQGDATSVNVTEYSNAYVGGVAGYNAGTIEVAVSHSYVNFDDEDMYALKYLYIGGIAGYCDSKGSILCCECDRSISDYIDNLASPASRVYFGGIVGNTYGTIQNCIYAASSIGRAKNYLFAGGIAGYQNSGTIEDVYVYAPDDGVRAYGGTEKTYCGGIVGYQSGGTITSAVSYQKKLTVYISTSTTSKGKLGYIAGASNGTLTSCYYNSGQSYTSSYSSMTPNGASATASNLLNKTYLASTTGFDMTNTWEAGVRPSVTYPTLKGFRHLFGYKVTVAGDYANQVELSDGWAYANTEVTVIPKDESKYVKSVTVDGTEISGDTFTVKGDCTVIPTLGDAYKLTKIGDAVECVTLSKNYATPGEKVTATIKNTTGKAYAYLLVNGVPKFDTSFEVTENSEIDVAFADLSSSGWCGSNVQYNLYDSGLLYIYGTGAMEDYTSENRPEWLSSDNNYGQDIEYVYINEGVTHIGDYSFYPGTYYSSYETKTKGIHLPESLISIGESAFLGCSNLEDITFPNTLESIGENALAGCTNIVSLVIPDKITSLEGSTFSQCTKLEYIVMPNGLTSIGVFAFEGCSKLTDVYYIGSESEWSGVTITDASNTYLTNSTMHYISDPSDVAIITLLDVENGTATLSKTKAVKGERIYVSTTPAGGYRNPKIEVDGVEIEYYNSFIAKGNQTVKVTFTPVRQDGTTVVASGQLGDIQSHIDWIMYKDGQLWIYGTKLSYTITSASNVPWVRYSTSIKKVVIEEGVTSLCEYAFYNCTKLTSVEIPKSLCSIGSRTFSGCSSLKSIDIPEKVGSIGSFAFYECSSLGVMDIPENVSSIGGSAFSGCTSLEQIVIPEKVKRIEDSVFSGCSNLKDISIKGNITHVGTSAFSGCTNLKAIDLNDRVQTINPNAFKNCSSIQSIIIPNSVSGIGSYSFDGCSNLKDVYYVGDASGWETLTGQVNNDCLTNATVHFIRSRSDIVALKILKTENGSATLSRFKTAIGETITVAATPTKGYRLSKIEVDGVPIEGKSFEVTGNNVVEVFFVLVRTDVTVVSGGQCGDDVYWALYEDGELLIYGNGAMENYTFNSRAPWYGSRSSIKNLIVEDGITSISQYSFKDCRELENVTFEGDVAAIGSYAFYNCAGLKSLEIPDDVTSIGTGAFENCTALRKIILYECIKSIGEKAFSNCSKLENVLFVGSSEDWGKIDIATGNDYLLNANRIYANYYDKMGRGDFDKNYQRNVVDALMLRRYLADWDAYKNLDTSVADLNSDGAVNDADLMILERHIAHWKGYETFPVTVDVK